MALQTRRLAVLLIFSSIAAGCGENVVILNSKLDAEETGYNNEFDKAHFWASDYAHSLFSALQDAKKFEDLGQTDERDGKFKKVGSYLKELQEESDKWLAELKKTLPPKAVSDAHQKLVRLLERSKSVTNGDEIADECRQYYAAIKKFDSDLDQRPYPKSRSGSWSVVYSPPKSPIGIDLASGAFTVDVNFETPLGDFKIGNSSSRGVKCSPNPGPRNKRLM